MEQLFLMPGEERYERFKDGNGVIVSKGQFVNGKKAGIWQFYEKGKLIKEVNMSFSAAENKTRK